MMSTQTTRQFYIIGNKHNVQQCVLALTGTTKELNGLWTVSADCSIVKGNVNMNELKEHEMDCDYSLELLSSGSSSSGKRPFVTPSDSSVHMKRLKSFGHSVNSASTQNSANNDIGYESDSTQSSEPEDGEVRADINAIVVEDENALHNKLVLFLFTWPIYIVLAIGSENTDLELYERLIKDLGVLAKLQEDDSSNLLVVGVAPNCTGEFNNQDRKLMEEQRDKLQVDTLESYFGSYFDSCEINQFSCKIWQSLHPHQCYPCKKVVGRKTVNGFFKGKRFVEMEAGENELLALLVEKKLLFCFNSKEKKFVCKPDDLMNEFTRALTKMSVVNYSSEVIDLLKSIEDVSERKTFIDAFKEAGVICSVKTVSIKTVHILPLICRQVIPVFDEEECFVETTALRLRVELEIIPKCLTSSIIKLLYEHNWTLKSSAPDTFGTTDSFVFENHSHGLIVQFGVLSHTSSFICLCGLGNASQKDLSSDIIYQELINKIECELKKWKNVPTPVDNFISYQVKPKASNNIKGILEMDEMWINVEKNDPLQRVNDIELLSPWFISEVKTMDEELNSTMSDALLTDISDLFSYGNMLFFVSLGLSAEKMSRIEKDNPRSTKDATFKMLLEWRKSNGLEANIATLRSAIKDSAHVTVNLHDFDEIVKKHQGKN